MAKHKKSPIIYEGQEHPDTRSRHYVDNDELYAALVARRELVDEALANGREVPPVSEYIGKCIYDIADNASRRHNFYYSYHYREEMRSEAIIKALKSVDKFDVTKGDRPFSYFTQVCIYRFLDIINIESRSTYIKLRMGMDADSNVDTLAENVGHTEEYVKSFVEEFEKRNELGRHRRARRSRQTKTNDDSLPIDEYLE